MQTDSQIVINSVGKLPFHLQQKPMAKPTAEVLFKNHPLHTAGSAGTSDKARIRVNRKMIDRADLIFVMERKHKQILIQRFDVTDKKLIVLDIEDNYQLNDPELVELLKEALQKYL
ncbi:MAG: protein tyrosine phosphatase [Mucilaginibacter sp.]|uniref:protein tyrosine phosphatase n=1 Tax=Mucilaginibacter sp. TaxID=1882438 RepID=UPI0031A054FA